MHSIRIDVNGIISDLDLFYTLQIQLDKFLFEPIRGSESGH